VVRIISLAMDASPWKRRKTSPTTSIPVDAPTTPSRIPVRTQPLSGRPSFASPTKASISKHHSQLLRRSSSVGAGVERPGSRGRDLQNVFAKALEASRPSDEGNDTPLARALGSTTPRGSTHRRTRSDGGVLSAKPRRMSRSPFKQPPPKPIETIEQDPTEEMQENIYPFVKKGLRRSPIAGSQAVGVLQDLQENINPFEKRGLRRSPVSSQAVEAVGEILGQTKAFPEVSISATDLLPSKTADPPELSRPTIPRESEPVTTQSTEPITLNSFERHGEALLTEKPTEPSRSPEPEQPIVLPSPQPERQRHLEETSKRPTRTSQAAEPVILHGSQLEEPELYPKTFEKPRTSETEQPIVLPSVERQRERHLEESSRRRTRSSQAAEPVSFSRRQHEEPELPPTPTQRGIPDPIVTTPPTGIHDTPSKRARKKQKLKSSPLKPRDQPLPGTSKITEPEAQLKPKKPQTAIRRRSSRFLVPEDPHATKKQTRDDLLRELQQLRADIALGNQENERLRLQSTSRKLRPTAPSNPDELLDMLLRATAPEPSLEPKPKPASVFKSIDSFLPFTSRRKQRATALPALDRPIPSHLPVPLDDPLPYLQVFSPLTYTSVITLLPTEPPLPETSAQEADQAVRQLHRIKASHPSGLFSARLLMTVNSSLLSITSLNIEALPSNAEKELGTFMREKSNPDAILNRDIGVMCWAMGSWVEISVLRARFWCAVEKEFGTSEARAKSLQRKGRKRKRRGSVVLDEDDGMGLDGNDDEETKRVWTMRQLLPHMGRTAMELSNDEVELRFEWRIGFDWTGEAESSISASAKLPKGCKCPSFLYSSSNYLLTLNRATT
jgi:hypothetical protein